MHGNHSYNSIDTLKLLGEIPNKLDIILLNDNHFV